MQPSFNRSIAIAEPLEVRRLLAYDLVPTAITGIDVNAVGSSFDAVVTVENLGTTTYSGQFWVRLSLSRDGTLGNSDDVQSSSLVRSATINNVNDAASNSVALSVSGTIPAHAGGAYRLGVFIEQYIAGPENNTSNNAFVTPTATIQAPGDPLWTSSTITGSAGDDVILITEESGSRRVSINGDERVYPFATLFIDAGAGNDKVVASDDVTIPLAITGSGGNDTIVGGGMNDELSGANGKDKLFGGAGHDYLLGGAQADYLTGGVGDDILSGAGGNDRLADVEGIDYLLGGAGNDVLLAREPSSGASDTLSGGAGTDSAELNDEDARSSIEQLLA
ncbi:MAG: hypothetical protein WBD40_15545 [Tepidisphaeraceae bacterium]